MKIVTVALLALVLNTCSRAPGTLEEVLATGELRVITRNSPTTFYRGPFGYEGPEYERVEAFRAWLQERYDRPIRVDYQITDSLPEILAAVESGRAHLAAASLTVTPARAQRVSFGKPYDEVSQYLVYRLNTGKPRSLDELAGKRLEILSGSSFGETLSDLQQSAQPGLVWTEHPQTGISDLLLAVQERRIDYTVADSIDFYVHRYYMPDIRKAMELKTGDKLAWAFAHRADDLRTVANAFLHAAAASGELQRIEEQYYGHLGDFDYVGTRTFKRHYASRLPDYRELFQRAAEQTNLDWRLLAAIGYQESHWDPAAVSPTGVRGLMMLTRTTAGRMGVEDRHDAAQSIDAGAQYFLNIYNRLDDVPEPDRVWFALAAYNVGYGHLQDARRLARREGLAADDWTVVRKMLPRLAKSEWHSQVPYGYARGWEPVAYVKNVRKYFEILSWLTLDDDIHRPARPRQFRQKELQTAAGSRDVSAT